MRGTLIALAASALALGYRPSPVEVDASTLPVEAMVAPTPLAIGSGDSLRITVSVTNPYAHGVVVALGGPPYITGQIPAAETTGAGFGARVVRTVGGPAEGPSEWTWGQPTVSLAPHETLRHTFVFGVGTDGAQGPVLAGAGRYRVIASFGRREAAPLFVTVRE